MQYDILEQQNAEIYIAPKFEFQEAEEKNYKFLYEDALEQLAQTNEQIQNLKETLQEGKLQNGNFTVENWRRLMEVAWAFAYKLMDEYEKKLLQQGQLFQLKHQRKDTEILILEEEMKRVKNNCEELQQVIKQNEDLIKDKEQEIQYLRQKLETGTSQLIKQSQEYNKLNVNFKENKAKSKQNMIEIAKLSRAKTDQYKEKCQQLQEEINKLDILIKQRNQEAFTLQQQLNELQNKYQSQLQDNEELLNEIDRIKQTQARHIQVLNQKQQDTVEEYEQELSQANNKLKDLEIEIEQLKKLREPPLKSRSKKTRN